MKGHVTKEEVERLTSDVEVLKQWKAQKKRDKEWNENVDAIGLPRNW